MTKRSAPWARRLALQVAEKPTARRLFRTDGDYGSSRENAPGACRLARSSRKRRAACTHGGVHRSQSASASLGVSSQAPCTAANRIRIRPGTVGPRSSRDSTTLTASGVNWISVDAAPEWIPVRRSPHRHEPAAARVRARTTRAALGSRSASAITPGQAVDSIRTTWGGWWVDRLKRNSECRNRSRQ